MKARLFSVFFLFFLVNFSFGQKFGYIDTEAILGQMKEYKEAQKEISKVSVQYQKEIEKMVQERDSLKFALNEVLILLTDEMVAKRQTEIGERTKAIQEKQRKIFGFDGLIFKKRQELIKPVQEKVYDAVQTVSKKQKVQVMFDKKGDLTIIYANPTHDYTDYVLIELGLKDPGGEEGENK